MRPIEIEAWVIRVLNRVVTKEPVEDSRVELKTVWPDEPWPTARRIGGNANAARGDPILWIIGADEKAGTIPGVHGRDLAGWYDPIRNLFDSVAPEPSDLIVQYGNATVVALVFDTSRSPYVVRNEGFGRVRGEPQKWEVPWRQLTSTRSATRHELLQLLVPALSKPDVELVSASAFYEPKANRPHIWAWHFSLSLYLVPQPNTRVAIPFHRCSADINAALSTAKGRVSRTLEDVSFSVTGGSLNVGQIWNTQSEIVVEAAGALDVAVSGSTEALTEYTDKHPLRLQLRLHAANVATPIVVDAMFQPKQGAPMQWKIAKKDDDESPLS